MGEMADMALSDVMDEEDARTDYRLGFMGKHAAYDRGIIDELGYEFSACGTVTGPSSRGAAPRQAATKTCSMCKKQGLHWESTEAGWRLFEPEGLIHDCGRLPQGERVTNCEVLMRDQELLEAQWRLAFSCGKYCYPMPPEEAATVEFTRDGLEAFVERAFRLRSQSSRKTWEEE